MGGKGGGKGHSKGHGKGKSCKGRSGPRPWRRSGGQALRRGPRASAARQPLQPTHAGAPPPLVKDATAPFLNPAARPLVKVPLEFESLGHWCCVIGNNILAEFWHVYREARPVFTGHCSAAGDELIISNAPADGLSQHLLIVNGQPRIAASQRIMSPGSIAVKLRGGSAQSGSVRSIGYVGSYLAEYAAVLELCKLPPKELTGPMWAILDPKVDVPGGFVRRRINVCAVPVNPSQAQAINCLEHALEKIQGPPGTGKSTTIFHILDARVPRGQRVLVTCSRNVAVESIAQKLAGLDDWPLCVFGPKDRVGETARRHLLDSQVGGHLDGHKVGRVAPLVAEHAAALHAAIQSREAACSGCRGERFLRAFLRKRHAAAYGLRDFCGRLGAYCAAAAGDPDWCRKQEHAGKDRVLTGARIFLCTIASTSRMLREWEETVGSELQVHTIIVDECGCTPESSTALLLRLRPQSLVLVGDHKQLPPTSLVPPYALEGTGHTRSLLERCVLASGRVHQLREQYRMHPSIAALVSGLFYAGRLSTPASVARSRGARESRPLVWHDVHGREDAPDRSYMNAAEVEACRRVCSRLRERVPAEATVALLTFYRGQLEQLMHALPSELDVEVLTVDACQGSEFDYVVLSTVRANRERRLGFVKDPQRICVAISRARLQLLIVGSRSTLAGDGDWCKVQEACQPLQPQEATPERALPVVGSFVSVFDALARQKERDAAQKAAAALEEEESSRSGRCSAGQALMWQQRSFRARGYGSRRPVEEPSLPRPEAYKAPQSCVEFEAQFPDLGAAVASHVAGREQPVRAPRASLRPATRNDERRARRKAQLERSLEPSEANDATVTVPAVPLPTEEQWEDVDEVVLFEMFPDDANAVEDALLRFAGLSHQGARALEALLARPVAGKAVLEGEDDLDYDCAPEEGVQGFEEDDEEDWPTGCAACGVEEVLEDPAADDGLFYCAQCWAEWNSLQPTTEVHGSDLPQAKASTEAVGLQPGGRQVERCAFFDSLDGMAKWAEAPPRPEAGGKELVTLESKEVRADAEAGPLRQRRWQRSAPPIPAAAVVSAAPVAETRALRCRRLLEALAVEDGIAEYISGLLEDDDDVDGTRDAALEILEGHGVDRGAAESFWMQLQAA